jgi:hypothetical protein
VDLKFQVTAFARRAEDPDAAPIGERPGLLVTPVDLTPVANAPLEILLGPLEAQMAVSLIDRCALHSCSARPAILGPQAVLRSSHTALGVPLAMDTGERFFTECFGDLQKWLSSVSRDVGGLPRRNAFATSPDSTVQCWGREIVGTLCCSLPTISVRLRVPFRRKRTTWRWRSLFTIRQLALGAGRIRGSYPSGEDCSTRPRRVTNCVSIHALVPKILAV